MLRTTKNIKDTEPTIGVNATVVESVVEPTSAAVETPIATSVNKRIKFTKGSQEAKDFMNMLRQRRASKK